MLTIEVKLNGKEIARATVENLSDLAAFSDYRVSAHEKANEALGTPSLDRTWGIECHKRAQSCWALVARVASAARMFQEEAANGVQEEDL